MSIERLEDRLLLATFVVNEDGFSETPDRNPGDGVCDIDTDNPGPQCTLRAAIEEANATAAIDTINFNVPVVTAGSTVAIMPRTQLPTIISPVIIDGTPPPGSERSPFIVLDGSNIVPEQSVRPNAASGLDITAGGSTVKGLVIVSFPGNGIQLRNGGGNLIVGNRIGTELGGTDRNGNSRGNVVDVGGGETVSAAGISIASSNNTIGGTAAGEMNLISGNIGNGIAIIGSLATDNVVVGNRIGTDVSGTRLLSNEGVGVLINNAKGNRIGGIAGTTPGGSCTGECNLISGNRDEGIEINLAQDADNLVQGNFIGTDVTGMQVVANRKGGIEIVNSSGNRIGGVTANARNVISGNGALKPPGDGGIQIFGTESRNNIVEGNFIGTDTTGTFAMGNDTAGILINGGASGNSIGVSLLFGERTACEGPCNLISGNPAGIVIADAGGLGAPALNLILTNNIGTDVTGTKPLPNFGDGILIQGGDLNQIGDPSDPSSRSNVIAFNEEAGVRIERGSGNKITMNSIFQNAGLGIDLGDDNTITRNDPLDADEGANNLQNFPVITSIEPAGGSTRIRGRLHSRPNHRFRVEFFGDAEPDQNGPLEGRTFLCENGSVFTEADGNALIDETCTGNFAFVSATVTDDETGDTSEFSATIIEVNSTGDLGDLHHDAADNDGICSTGQTTAEGEPECTLRAAIEQANFNSVKDLIAFNLPLPDFAPIAVTTPLPEIIHPVTIDGFTQSGSGTPDQPGERMVRIDGSLIPSSPSSDGLVITASKSEIRGLAIAGFSGSGIVVDVESNVVIEHNRIESSGCTGIVVRRGTGVRISQNTFVDNGRLAPASCAGDALAIDLGADGVTENNASGHDGPNRFQNFPVIDRAIGGRGLTVRGSFDALPGQEITLEFFVSSSCDHTKHNDAGTFVGSISGTAADVTTPYQHRFELDFDIGPDDFITATATNSRGNTSELSFCAPVSEPLIFVNGVAGALLQLGDTPLWIEPFFAPVGAPTRDPFLSLEPGTARPFLPVVATDVTRTVFGQNVYGVLLATLTDPARGGYREYDMTTDPTRRTAGGCDADNQRDNMPDLFVFPYDWRKSNIDNARLLKEYVACIQQFYPDTKVDILAHSMGGIQSRRYILDNPTDHNVDQLITVGSPFLGAVKGDFALLTGGLFGAKDPADAALEILSSSVDGTVVGQIPASVRIRALAEFYRGPHELLSSKAYFDLGGEVFSEGSFDFNDDGMFTTYGFNEFFQAMNKIFPNSTPATTSALFHLGEQDDWHTSSFGVEYTHIVGVQPNDKTVERLIPIDRPVCEVRPIDQGTDFVCNQFNTFLLDYGKGDGTVPRLSAERRGNGLDLNAPDESVSVPDGGVRPQVVPRVFSGNECLIGTDPDKGCDHNGLLANPKVLDFILDTLAGRQPTSRAAARSATVSTTHLLRLTNADSIEIADAFGNVTSPTSLAAGQSPVPNISVNIAGEHAYDLALPADQTYTIKFPSNGGPVALELVREAGDVTNRAVRYVDLSLPAGGTAMLHITPDAIDPLRFDANGDGTFERTIMPSADLSGPTAADVDAPRITAQTTPNGTRVSVTLTATDAGSGVNMLRFSLDGVRFLPVAGPIDVDPSANPVVFAFADDNAGNRSGIFTFDLRRADLTIVETGAPPTVVAGGNVTYRFTIANRGPSAAENAVFTDSLPSELSLVSIDAGRGDCDGQQIITCELGTLASGEAATIEIVAAAPLDPAVLRNRAEVHSRQTDPNPQDNAVETLTQVVASDIESLAVADSDLVVPAGPASNTAFSDSGQIVAFQSTTAGLDPNFADTNGQSDVFVKNLITGDVQLVSVNRSGGEAGNGASTNPSISGNGRFVAFASNANDLVSGLADRGSIPDPGGLVTPTSDVFVRDLLAGTTQLVSVNRDGTAGLRGGPFKALKPVISRDGRFVAFFSDAPDLVAGVSDSNNGPDLFVRDLAAGTTRLVTINAAGTAAGNLPASVLDTAVFSGNSRFLAFTSGAGDLATGTMDANNTGDVFVYDLLAGTTRAVSVNSAGTATANNLSTSPSISDDGNRIAFESQANNLVDGVRDDSTGFLFPTSDIFVRDMVAGVTRIISVDRTGRKSGNAVSRDPAISGDGHTLAFASFATDLAPGVPGDGTSQLFVHQLDTGETTAAVTGVNANIFDPALSADGRFVAFLSSANNLVPNDTVLDNSFHVYVRDVTRGQTVLVDVSAAGVKPFRGLSFNQTTATISRNGRFVGFVGGSGELVPGGAGGELYVRDLTAGSTIAVNSRSIEDSPSFPDRTARDCALCEVAISENGRFAVFTSTAPDLAPGDANTLSDVFRRDLVTGAVDMVSVNSSGRAAGNRDSGNGGYSVSDDSRFVVFASSATDLVAGVTDTNRGSDIFLRDMQTGITTLVSASTIAGRTSNAESTDPVISRDGRKVAFASRATDLVAGVADTNGRTDVFVRDLTTGMTSLVSIRSDGTAAANADSGEPVFSADGLKLAFGSLATDLIAGVADTAGTPDAFVRDLVQQTTMIASVNDSDTTAAGVGVCCVPVRPNFSANGQFVAFLSSANNLVPGVSDTNNNPDVFVRDLTAGTTRLVSVTPGGGAAGNFGVSPIEPAINDDGSTLAFWSPSSNLTSGPPTNGCNLFVRDLVTARTTVASVNSAGVPSSGGCNSRPQLSADGRIVAFESEVADLVPGVIDNDSRADVFLRDRSAGVTQLVSHNTAGNSFASTATVGDVTSQLLALSRDGGTVIFRTGDAQLTPNGPGLAVFRADPNPSERFQFSVPEFTAKEDGGNALVTITRQFPHAGPASVRLTTHSGSATGGDDFTAVSQVVNFVAGEFVRNVLVPVLDDTSVEGDEIVNLVLSDPSAPATLGVQSAAELRILDNDLAGRITAASNRVLPDNTIDRYRYTAAQDGVLTIQLHGGGNVLEVFDQFGNRRFSVTGGLDKQADLGGVRAGEVFTIAISQGFGLPYDLKVVNVLARRTDPGGDRLEFTASGERDVVNFGIPLGSSTGSGDVRDVLLTNPELPASIRRTRYDPATLASRLGAAPLAGLTIRNLRGSDGVLIDPTITLPFSLASGITDDAATTRAGAIVTINVLANDGDPAERLRVASVSRPSQGIATDNHDGTVTYVSVAGFVGNDEFRYEVIDESGASEFATVRVEVTAGPPPNTDTVPPTSSVNPLPPQLGTRTFDVSWSGDDNADGSGIASFDIFVSDNGGPFLAAATATQTRSLSFTGEFGHTYGFFSVATDVAGNRQPTPAAAQATTTLIAPPNGPHVTGLRLPGNGRTVKSLLLTFDRDLNRTAAQQIANYELRAPGGDTAFNTADDVILRLGSAKYNVRTRTVTLKPGVRLTVNLAFQLTVRDAITDTVGNRLDGNNDSLAGGDHVVRGGRWTTIVYRDSNGDRVTLLLELRHPSRGDSPSDAGLMEVVWGPGITGRRLILSDTAPGESVLLGTVEPGPGGDGQTVLESITGLADVQRRFPQGGNSMSKTPTSCYVNTNSSR